jgi:GAF domain-containing protein
MQGRQVRLFPDPAVIRDEIPLPADLALWDGSLSAILSLPLEAYGKVVGALTFATEKPEGYTSEDVKVAVAIAAHLALAIDRWNQTQELQRVSAELARLASFPALNPAAIIEVDLAGHVHYLNPAAAEMFPECRQNALDAPILVDLPSVAAILHGDMGHPHIRELRACLKSQYV